MASPIALLIFLCCVLIPINFKIVNCNCSCAGSGGSFGNIMLLSPTGRKNGGVAESQAAIRAYINLANKYRSIFERVGKELGIPPAVIAAVASRESNFGASLTADGLGDNDNAYGMMQIDKRHCQKYASESQIKSHKRDGYEHVYQATEHNIKDNLDKIKKNFPSWSEEQQLQGAVAAYNFGLKNVKSWEKLDVGTTDNDYSNDVMARAQYLIDKENW